VDSDRISRLQREVALLARQIAGLPVRIAESGGGDPSLPFQLAVVTGYATEPAYTEAGGGFAIEGTADTHSGRAILLEDVALNLQVSDLSDTALEFSFANAHRDVIIGLGDVIRVWHRDGIPVTAGMLNSPPLYAPIYGEHFNVTDYLRRLAGYDPEADDPPLLLHTTADEIYWQEGEGLVGPQGPQGPSGPGPQEGYATDVAGDVVNFAPTEITGFSASEFQFFAHDKTAGETTDENDPPWKTISQYDATKKQLPWHQAGAFNFETTTDYGGSATEPQFLVNWGAGNGGDWQWKSATGYDNTDSTQLLGHINGTWQWKTIAEWLNLLAGYAAGSDQIIGHAAGGATEWKTLASKTINNPTDIDLTLDSDSLDSTLDYVPVTVKLWPAAADGGAATFGESVGVEPC